MLERIEAANQRTSVGGDQTTGYPGHRSEGVLIKEQRESSRKGELLIFDKGKGRLIEKLLKTSGRTAVAPFTVKLLASGPRSPQLFIVSVMSEEEELSYREAIQKASDSITRFPLIPVRGVPLMSHIANNWDSIWAFRPDPSDLLIATYPKAGTTWTQEIVDLLLHNGDAEACKRAPTPVRSPFLEIYSPPPIPSGLDLLKKTDPPRMIKTHLPLQLVPPGFWENKCKVIYVARNAKDNLVSYYFFDCMNLTQPEPGPWEGYLPKFMQGELSWGSWYDHVKGYWMEREKKNILYLFYEDLKENPRREVERIMRYLDLSVSDEVISRIVELTSFKSMKENPMANYSCIPTPVFDQSISSFMRKGEVGDWRNHFTPEQSKTFDEDYEKQMKDVNIPFRTFI